jgi:putative DNA primase/helicase
MTKQKEKAASGQLAAGALETTAQDVSTPHNSRNTPNSQESYLKDIALRTERVIAMLQLDTDTSLIKAELGDWADVFINALSDNGRQAAKDHVRQCIMDLSPDLRARAEFLFFGQISPENVPDELETLAAAFGILPYGATWAEMLERIGPVAWEWDSWLPSGFLTIVAGEPGQGKSVLCLRIAASYLLGVTWPDGTSFTKDKGAVLWCEAEAAQALNLERAKAWGLPLERIYTPLDDPLADIQLDIPEHQQVVKSLAGQAEVRLIVVDSLRGIHRGDENSSASMEIVKWLAELARDTGKPILLTHHLRKRGILDVGDKVTLDRIRGSSAIIQAARMVWAIDAPDPGEEVAKRLSVIKSNLARFPDPIGFTIGDNARLTFGNAPEAPRQESQLDKAIDLLKALLNSGPVASADLQDEADGAGLSWDTMKKAKVKMGIVAARDGRERKWYWSLPAREDLPPS